MGLPTIQYPTFSLNLPVSKKEILLRVFTVKEEKALLLAMNSDDALKAIPRVIQSIIQDCIVEPKNFDVNKIAVCDLEYIFINQRMNSVGSVLEIELNDKYNEKVDVSIDLSTLELETSVEHEYILPVTDNVTLFLRDPNFSLVQKIMAQNDEDGKITTDLITNCIDKIMEKNGEEDLIHNIEDFTQKEQEEWINTFSSSTLNKFDIFLKTLPKNVLKIKFKNSKDEDETMVLENIHNFFT